MVDGRVLQQFAQETVQGGGSIPVQSNALKTTRDGSLVCIVNYYLWIVMELLITVAVK